MAILSSSLLRYILITSSLYEGSTFQLSNIGWKNKDSCKLTCLSSTSSNTINADFDILPEIRSAVYENENGENQWKESIQMIQSEIHDDSIDEEELELQLATAFRWKAYVKASKTMRKYQNPKIPDPMKIQEALVWLQTGPLELTKEQLWKNIQNHPQTYLLDPQSSFQKAMGSAPKKYRDPTILTKLIEEDPSVLQVSYNCADDGCASECGNCWVAYGNRLSF